MTTSSNGRGPSSTPHEIQELNQERLGGGEERLAQDGERLGGRGNRLGPITRSMAKRLHADLG